MSTLVLAGRYEIVEKIGDGGMAVVYKARDKLLSRFVAIKILRKEYVFDQTFVENFRNESMAAGSLVHPNIVTIYDVGKDRDINYIVMEYVEGRALSDVIAAEAPLDYKRTISIGKQVASALDLAHRSGIIHRDVKPHNILITEDGTAKITDFGIAKAVSDGTIISESGVIMGSVHYFSPEQSRGQYVDEKTDIYSLGIVLYEMLTGRVPFDADNPVTIAVMHMNDSIIPPSRMVNGVPPGLDMIVMKATAKYQSDRFRNIDEMYKALDNVNFITGIIDDPEIAGFVKPAVITESTPGRGYNNSSVETVPETPVAQSAARSEFENNDRYAPGQQSSQKRTDPFYDDDDDDPPPYHREPSRSSSDDEHHEKKKEGFIASFSRLETKYKVIAIIVVVVVAFLISIPIQRLFSNVEYVVVPNVVGMYYEDAEPMLRDLGFVVEPDLVELPSTNNPISAPAAALEDGDTNSYSAAELEAATAGASNTQVTPVTQNFKVGMVMEQDPVGGSQARYGYKVKLKVASPAATPADTIEQEEPKDPIAVPNLVGLTKANAQKMISDAGFRLGTVRYEASDETIDSVISQTPKAGEMLVPGMSIGISVSTGPKQAEVTLLNYVGKPRAEAEAALVALKLVVNVLEETSASPPGTVIAMNPAAGQTVDEGSTVTLTVSKGTIVPDLTGMTISEAQAALATAGLRLGTYVAGNAAPTAASADRIYIQDQAVGTTVTAGSPVNVTYYGAYNPVTYTVTFIDGVSGTEIAKYTNVLPGTNIADPGCTDHSATHVDGGWSGGDFTNVQSDLTITRIWTPITPPGP